MTTESITQKKKSKIDEKDKLILKRMLDNGCADDRWLSTNKLTTLTKLNWNTVYDHLKKLQRLHYVEFRKVGLVREFERDGRSVKSEREIEWKLNVEEE